MNCLQRLLLALFVGVSASGAFAQDGDAITDKPKIEMLTCNVLILDPDGNPVAEHGKAIYVLKKQPQAGWKILIDIWNADPPVSSAGP